MGILDTIKKLPSTIKAANVKRVRKNKREASALRAKRAKHAPLIQKIAREYGADVELLDKAAYVTKKVKGEERGVHISYGLDSEDIRNKMDRAFYKSSTVSKIKAAVKTGKQIHKQLKESGIKGGSMWGDPGKLYR